MHRNVFQLQKRQFRQPYRGPMLLLRQACKVSRQDTFAREHQINTKFCWGIAIPLRENNWECDTFARKRKSIETRLCHKSCQWTMTCIEAKTFISV